LKLTHYPIVMMPANNLALFSGSTQGVASNACPRRFPDEFAGRVTASGGA